MQSDLEKLVSLAELISSDTLTDTELFEKIIEYSELFTSWYGAWEKASFQEPEPANRQLLLSLETSHAEVLKKAQLLSQRTSDTLKKMKVRGKSILAYVDQLPRQVSIFRKRQG